MRTVRNIFRWGMSAATALIMVIYLLICLIPYVNTGKYWVISILGLGFILIFFALIILLIYWLILRSWLSVVCLIVLLAGYQQISVAFAFHFPSSFSMEKPSGELRVMQWNVHNWNQIFFENENPVSKKTQPKMMALIKEYNPDILCTEEFFESTDPKRFKSNILILKEMGYPYHFFINNDIKDGFYYAGIAIFSKYPIQSSGKITVASKLTADPLAFADVSIRGKTIRVMAVHLQSVRFEKNDYSNIQNMKNPKDPSLNGSKTIVSKLKLGFQKRYEQSVIVNQEILQSPYPVILCGDFNDVPSSGVYFNIRKNLQDAFLKKGSFVGRSYRFISPTLRIDYILPSRSMDVRQFKIIHVNYSDHYPLVADLKL